MAHHDRLFVLQAMISQGVIPVFYHPDTELCKNVIQACANAGAKCVEFTNRLAAAVLNRIRYCEQAMDALVVGQKNDRLALFFQRRQPGFQFIGAATLLMNQAVVT